MNKRGLLVILFFAFISYNCFGQSGMDLIALTLPSELTENSNAVIRNESWDIVIDNVDQLTTKRTYVVTILNKIGHERFSDTYVHYDQDEKIKKLSAKMYDALGKEIKKFSKNKFTDVSAVDGFSLYQSSRVKFVEYTPVSYPYTLVFEVEETSGTTGFIPRWLPLSDYHVGVQKSTYRITNNTNSEIRFKEKNFEGYVIEKETFENGFQYTAKNLEPIKFESGSIGIRNLVPQLMVALNDFALKGVKGSAKDWKEFGKWVYDKLIEGRSVLDEATKAEIRSKVLGVEDPIEKAKIVYQYVQDKTRYISVQVGIGGWEPIAANKVDEVGYGDCKGLTNYTKALLEVVGIESFYTIIYAGNRTDVDPDFAMMQGNHAILNVPINGKEIWLECTSQSIPFGFLGDFTDNRKVVIVTPEGGVVKTTSSYLNEENLQTTTAAIQLDPEGNVNANLVRASQGIQYSGRYRVSNDPLKEQKKYYKSDVWSYNNNLEVNSIKIDNDKDSVLLKEDLSISINRYASITGNDYLFRVNVFNRNSYVPKRYRNRKLPLQISRGYKDVDEYTFTIPEGYSIAFLPEEKIIQNKFGEYKVNFKKVDDNTFTYHKTLLIKAGEYPKEDYKLYRKFRKSVAKYENLRISLTKTP